MATACPKELRERAVRLVREAKQNDPQDRGAITRVVKQLSISYASLLDWYNQSEVDDGNAPGITTDQAAVYVDVQGVLVSMRVSGTVNVIFCKW